MENGHDGSKYSKAGMCEKIFCCFCPNFQSNHDANHRLAKGYGAGGEAGANDMARMPKAGVVFPTKIYGERQHGIVSLDSQERDKKTPGLDKSDTFSDYINRTKFKIRASESNVENVASGEDYVYEKEKDDDGKDVFSDFVNRTKIKIRKTSSIGSKSRNISFKN